MTTTRKNTPDKGVNYLSLDTLTPFEREVFDLALAALGRPPTPRQTWFRKIAQEMVKTSAKLDA